MEDIPTDISSICDELINFEPEIFKRQIMKTDDDIRTEPENKKKKMAMMNPKHNTPNSVEVRSDPPSTEILLSEATVAGVSIADAKASGLNTINSMRESSNRCLVFLSVGTGVWTGAGNAKREFISHVGAFSQDISKGHIV